MWETPVLPRHLSRPHLLGAKTRSGVVAPESPLNLFVVAWCLLVLRTTAFLIGTEA
jgi:hypothetical protein